MNDTKYILVFVKSSQSFWYSQQILAIVVSAEDEAAAYDEGLKYMHDHDMLDKGWRVEVCEYEEVG